MHGLVHSEYCTAPVNKRQYYTDQFFCLPFPYRFKNPHHQRLWLRRLGHRLDVQKRLRPLYLQGYQSLRNSWNHCQLGLFEQKRHQFGFPTSSRHELRQIKRSWEGQSWASWDWRRCTHNCSQIRNSDPIQSSWRRGTRPLQLSSWAKTRPQVEYHLVS